MQKKHIKLTVILSCVLAVILIITLLLVYVFSNGLLYRDETAMSSEHFTVNAAMASYMYHSYSDTELTENGDYYAYAFGYDPEISLKEQYIDAENKTSFHTYMLNLTKDHIGELLVYAEAAVKSGVTLSDKDNETIENSITQLKLNAESENVSFNKYLKDNYGRGVRESDIRESLKIMKYAEIQYDSIENGFSPTDADILKCYNENKKYIDVCSYIPYTFNGTTAPERSKELAALHNEDEFCEYIAKFMRKNGKVSNTSKAYEEIEKIKVIDAKNTDTSITASDWLYDTSRKVGDTTVTAENDEYTVYFILMPAHKDETKSVNIRHILLSVSKYSNVTAAKVKADEIMAEWIKHGKTADEFAELAALYSEDENSASNGGLYKNYRAGDIDDAYEFDEWCFTNTRKQGDTEVLSTEYGAHVMYLESFGYSNWQLDTIDILSDEAVDNAHNDYYKKYEVECFDSVFNSIE